MAEEKKEAPKKKMKKKKKKNKNEIGAVEVDDEVLTQFNLVYANKIRYAIYRLDEDEKIIILDSVSPNKETLKSLKEKLPENDVRWIVCCLSYKLQDQSQRKKILFISWIPDKIKRKTHKETIRVKSLGIFHQAHIFQALNGKSMKQIQANDYDDLEQNSLLQSVASYGEQIDFDSLWTIEVLVNYLHSVSSSAWTVIMILDTRNILNLIVVFAILSALTAGIDLNQFKNKLKKPKGVSIGLLCQFGILPVSSFLVAYLLDHTFDVFSQSQGVALIILGSCPGGNISNIFCFLWNADLSLSIAMTTASSVLSFAFLTANCAIYIPLYTKGSDTATIDYVSLAFSVGMVISGICVGFTAAYIDNNTFKKVLGVFGFVATCYMIYIALSGNAMGSAPIWTLSWPIWLAPLFLCSTAWILSLVISTIFKLPKKSVLTVCLESANQNSVLSAAIIYLSLDDYEQEDIDLAIGIPIMYTIICVLYDGLGGLISCQLKWVSCRLPDDPQYIDREDGEEEDETITLSDILYRYKQWRQSKKTMQLLNQQDMDYGGTNAGNIVMTLEQANYTHSDNEAEKSSDTQILTQTM